MVFFFLQFNIIYYIILFVLYRSNQFIPDITTIFFEVFARSVKGLMSNPENDPIDALFFTVNNEKAK